MTASLTAGAKLGGKDGGYIILDLSDPLDRISSWFRKAEECLNCRLTIPAKKKKGQLSGMPAPMQDGVRLPWAIYRNTPSSLILHIAMRGVPAPDGVPERGTVQKTRNHFSTISIRTRPVKREFRKRHPSCGAPEPHQRGVGGGQE